MAKFLVLIPARFESTRFPGKPLAKINNIPMIEYVVKNCAETGFDYAVVTDDTRIEEFVKSINGSVVRVDDNVPSGSERIALAYQRYFSNKEYDFVINVQGDEPLLKAQEIRDIANFHADKNFDICTAVKKRKSTEEDFQNANVVKAAYSELTHQCLYFSRNSIPFNREGKLNDWYQHIGIYSYKTNALVRFVNLPVSSMEDTEKLEQLRALENGLTIGAKTTNVTLIGVDTPQDIHKIEGVLREQKN